MILFVAPETDEHNEILNTLTSWSALSLLQPFAWWSLAKGESVDPPRRVTVVRDGRATESALANALGVDTGNHDLIVVQLVDESIDEGTDWLAKDAQRARDAFDRVLSGNQVSETLHLLIPTRRDAKMSSQHISAGWDHVLLVPDNREDPVDAVDFLADHPELVPLHAAHALAAIGQLLVGSLPSEDSLSSIIEQELRRDHGEAKTLLSLRLFSRLVDFGYLLDDLASGLKGSTQEPPLPTSRHARLEPDQRYLSSIAEAYVSAHLNVFAGTPAEAEDPVKKIKGLWPYIKLIFGVLKKMLLSKPAEWANVISQKVYDGVAKRLEGLGKSVTGLEVDRWNDTGPQAEAPDEAFNAPTVDVDGAVAPAWHDLVDLVLGLVDGGLIPADVRNNLSGADALTNRVVGSRFLVADVRSATKAGQLQTLLDYIRTLVSAFRSQVKKDIEIAEVREKALAEQVEIATKKLEKAGKKSMIRGLARAVMVSSLICGLGVWANLRYLGDPVRVVLLFASPVIWFVIFLAQVIGVIIRRLRRQRKQLALHKQHRHVVQRHATLTGDDASIGRRLSELDDWNAILVRFLHQPHAGATLVGGSSERISGDELPPSFRAASATTEAEVHKTLVARCRRKVFGPAWISELFENLVENAMKDLIAERGEPPEDIGTVAYDPYSDVSPRSDSPRRFLLAQLTTGTMSPLSTTAVDRGLIDELGALLVGVAGGVGENATLLTHNGATDEIAEVGTRRGNPANFAGGGLSGLQAKLRPGVVRIATNGPAGSFGGTGFIAAGDGLIITNKHVVENSETITVQLSSGAQYAATLLEVSEITDLAALRIDLEHLGALTVGSALPAVGQEVYSMGYPLLLDGEPTFSKGIITAIERQLPSPTLGEADMRVLQADFRLAGGASGSPVVDAHGVVVGVHFASRVPLDDDADDAQRGVAEQWDFASFLVPSDELATFVGSVVASNGFTLPVGGLGYGSDHGTLQVSAFLDQSLAETSSLSGYGGEPGRPSASFDTLVTTASPIGQPLSTVAELSFGGQTRLIRTTVHAARLQLAGLMKTGSGE